MQSGEFPLKIGDTVTFSKTVGESDINQFAGVSGDFARNHVDEEYMRANGGGGRIAHGALMVAYMSTASTRMSDRLPDDGALVPVSMGYDKVRFLKPVRINDTVVVTYSISDIDTERKRSISAIEVRNQKGELVAVATHILALVEREKLFG